MNPYELLLQQGLTPQTDMSVIKPRPIMRQPAAASSTPTAPVAQPASTATPPGEQPAKQKKPSLYEKLTQVYNSAGASTPQVFNKPHSTTTNTQRAATYDPNSFAEYQERLRQAEQDPLIQQRKKEAEELLALSNASLPKDSQQGWMNKIDLRPIMSLIDAHRGTNVAPYMGPSAKENEQSRAKMLLDNYNKFLSQQDKISADAMELAKASKGSESASQQKGFSTTIVNQGLGSKEVSKASRELRADAKAFASDNSKALESVRAFKKIQGLLRLNVPGAGYLIRVALARAAGDDKISNADIQSIAGSEAVIDIMKRLREQKKTGQMTPKDIADFSASISALIGGQLASLKSTAAARARSFAMNSPTGLEQSDVEPFYLDYTGLSAVEEDFTRMMQQLLEDETLMKTSTGKRIFTPETINAYVEAGALKGKKDSKGEYIKLPNGMYQLDTGDTLTAQAMKDIEVAASKAPTATPSKLPEDKKKRLEELRKAQGG